MRSLIAILGVAALVAGMAVIAQEGNIVPNGDFEKGDEGWLFDVIVAPSEASICTEDVHGGSNSYLIKNGKDARGFARSPAFEVEPGKSYRLSVWAKAEGAAEDMVYARVHWWKGLPGIASEEKIKDDTEHAGGTFDWQELAATVTAPGDAKMATVRLETNGDTGVLNTETEGEFWVRFDDLSVTPAQ